MLIEMAEVIGPPPYLFTSRDRGERPAEIHKQIVAVYGNVMNRQNVTKWCRELCEGRTDVHDEQRAVGHL
jgi:hypothetical protein